MMPNIKKKRDVIETESFVYSRPQNNVDQITFGQGINPQNDFISTGYRRGRGVRSVRGTRVVRGGRNLDHRNKNYESKNFKSSTIERIDLENNTDDNLSPFTDSDEHDQPNTSQSSMSTLFSHAMNQREYEPTAVNTFRRRRNEFNSDFTFGHSSPEALSRSDYSLKSKYNSSLNEVNPRNPQHKFQNDESMAQKRKGEDLFVGKKMVVTAAAAASLTSSEIRNRIEFEGKERRYQTQVNEEDDDDDDDDGDNDDDDESYYASPFGVISPPSKSKQAGKTSTIIKSDERRNKLNNEILFLRKELGRIGVHDHSIREYIEHIINKEEEEEEEVESNARMNPLNHLKQSQQKQKIYGQASNDNWNKSISNRQVSNEILSEREKRAKPMAAVPLVNPSKAFSMDGNGDSATKPLPFHSVEKGKRYTLGMDERKFGLNSNVVNVQSKTIPSLYSSNKPTAAVAVTTSSSSFSSSKDSLLNLDMDPKMVLIMAERWKKENDEKDRLLLHDLHSLKLSESNSKGSDSLKDNNYEKDFIFKLLGRTERTIEEKEKKMVAMDEQLKHLNANLKEKEAEIMKLKKAVEDNKVKGNAAEKETGDLGWKLESERYEREKEKKEAMDLLERNRVLKVELDEMKKKHREEMQKNTVFESQLKRNRFELNNEMQKSWRVEMKMKEMKKSNDWLLYEKGELLKKLREIKMVKNGKSWEKKEHNNGSERETRERSDENKKNEERSNEGEDKEEKEKGLNGDESNERNGEEENEKKNMNEKNERMEGSENNIELRREGMEDGYGGTVAMDDNELLIKETKKFKTSFHETDEQQHHALEFSHDEHEKKNMENILHEKCENKNLTKQTVDDDDNGKDDKQIAKSNESDNDNGKDDNDNGKDDKQIAKSNESDNDNGKDDKQIAKSNESDNDNGKDDNDNGKVDNNDNVDNNGNDNGNGNGNDHDGKEVNANTDGKDDTVNNNGNGNGNDHDSINDSVYHDSKNEKNVNSESNKMSDKNDSNENGDNDKKWNKNHSKEVITVDDDDDKDDDKKDDKGGKDDKDGNVNDCDNKNNENDDDSEFETKKKLSSMVNSNQSEETNNLNKEVGEEEDFKEENVPISGDASCKKTNFFLVNSQEYECSVESSERKEGEMNSDDEKNGHCDDTVAAEKYASMAIGKE